MYFAAVSALLLPALAVASPQYGYVPPSGPATSGGSSSSSSSAPVPTPSLSGQQIIQVDPTGLLNFVPNNITVAENDTVTFVFPPGAVTHSVTQSSFAQPCTLLNEGSTNSTVGFDSGLTSGTEFSIVITNASQPIWFHCKQFGPPSHCGSGMVGAINAPTTGTNTFSAYLSAASAAGTGFPVDTATGGLAGLGASATAPAASASAAPTTSTSSGTQLIAGAVSGLVAVFAAISLLA